MSIYTRNLLCMENLVIFLFIYLFWGGIILSVLIYFKILPIIFLYYCTFIYYNLKYTVEFKMLIFITFTVFCKWLYHQDLLIEGNVLCFNINVTHKPKRSFNSMNCWLLYVQETWDFLHFLWWRHFLFKQQDTPT